MFQELQNFSSSWNFLISVADVVTCKIKRYFRSFKDIFILHVTTI